VRTGLQLRHGSRWGAPVGARAASLGLGGALLTAIAALAAPGFASAQPGPDPYRPQTAPAQPPPAQPASPAPDPAPTATERPSTTPAVRVSSPDAAPQTPSTTAPQTRSQVQTPRVVETQTPRVVKTKPKPARTSTPKATSPPTTKSPTLPVAAAAASTEPTGGPLLLGALALFALALASGGLLHLLTRTDGLWGKA
jgi:outer membrane biosynthesis protein TonB